MSQCCPGVASLERPPQDTANVNAHPKLDFLTRGTRLPDSNWLNQALVALGHTVIENGPGAGHYDVLLVHDPSAVTVSDLRAAQRAGAVTILRAWSDPETLEAAGASIGAYDWIVTNGLAETVSAYAALGGRALPLLPSAPPVALSRKPKRRDFDIVFAGRLTGPERKFRLDLLRRMADKWKVAVITDDSAAWEGAYPLAAPDLVELHRRARVALHTDRIALNRFGITRACPGRRCFFGLALGCALMAELRPWLLHCFNPASELIGFSSEEHALQQAAALLENPPELDRIAAAGQRRVLADHLPEQRARQLVTLARGAVPTAMRVLAIGPWYQQIELPGEEKTCLLEHSNIERWKRLEPVFPDVRGRSVLDLGMNAGFFSLQCLRRGCSRVCGVERSALACAQARLVFELWNEQRIEIIERDVLNAPIGPFDICLALALLHHFDDIEPLLRVATARSRELVLEWHLKEGGPYHPLEEVTRWLETAGWRTVAIVEGQRPILIARAREPRIL
jgi:hypothetical protein